MDKLCILCVVFIVIQNNTILSNPVQFQDVIINKLNEYSNKYTSKQFGNIIMSFELISDKHLCIVIDDDASDLEEQSHNYDKMIPNNDLFEIVTFRPPTTTNEFNTSKSNPVAYGKYNFNYRTSPTTQRTTTRSTTLEPWVYNRYTRRYSWADYYTTPPTKYDETVSDEHRKIASSIDSIVRRFSNSTDKYPYTDFVKLIGRLNSTNLFNISDSDFF